MNFAPTNYDQSRTGDWTRGLVPPPPVAPTEVLPRLFLGNRQFAEDQQWLNNNKISFILSLDRKLNSPVPNTFIGLVDGAGNKFQRFEDAVNKALGKLEAGDRVLVHCHAGVSRSAAVAAGVLIKAKHFTRLRAISEIGNRRPIQIHEEFKPFLMKIESALMKQGIELIGPK